MDNSNCSFVDFTINEAATYLPITKNFSMKTKTTIH